MIAKELLSRIKRIHITGSRAVDSVMAGHYRSAFRGTGMEFEEFREYSPGDEVRNIDWKVSARFNRPFIKLYREEREQTVMLLVDMSASGAFGTTDSLKKEKAVETAAVLAFNAIRNNDKVGAVLFTDRVEKYIPPKKGSSHVWRVIKELVSYAPEGRGTSISTAVDFLTRVARKKTVSFVISDFIDTGYERSLKRLSTRHDTIAVLVTDKGDFTLPAAGLLEVFDNESGKTAVIDCSSAATRKSFEQLQRKRHEDRLTLLKRSGIESLVIDTSDISADELRGFFLKREKRYR